jgi:quercetin dioxygenase-like cupin family protein
MTESKYLGGKVVVRSLPQFSGPAGGDAPVVKRLLLPQGELAQFYDADEAVRYMACIELRAGTVRGNHYHLSKEESIYVLRGEVLLQMADIESRESASVPLRMGDRAAIQTRVAHALVAVNPGFAIEWSSVRFDPADTYRYPLA